MSIKNENIEKDLELFTASFLLSEFRRDIRALHEEFRKDVRAIHSDMNAINNRIDTTNQRIDTTNSKIDNKFTWTIGIQVASLITILGVILTIILTK